MHVLWFTGLRGAVAYACARDFPDKYGNNATITFTTMVIVFVTIVIMGGAVEPLLSWLDIRMDVDEKEYMRQWRLVRRLKGWYHEWGKKRQSGCCLSPQNALPTTSLTNIPLFLFPSQFRVQERLPNSSSGARR